MKEHEKLRTEERLVDFMWTAFDFINKPIESYQEYKEKSVDFKTGFTEALEVLRKLVTKNYD